MYRSGRRPNSRCSGCPSGPTEVSRQQPSPGEPVFAIHAQADRHAVTLAIAVSEFKFPVFDTGFRHVEGHHPDIVPEVPPTVIFLEEAAGFAHENGEGHVLAVEGFQQGRRRFRSGASTRT